MRLVTVTFKVPESMLKKLDDLVEKGLFTNRSEAIRHAIRLLLQQQGLMGGYDAEYVPVDNEVVN